MYKCILYMPTLANCWLAYIIFDHASTHDYLCFDIVWFNYLKKKTCKRSRDTGRHSDSTIGILHSSFGKSRCCKNHTGRHIDTRLRSKKKNNSFVSTARASCECAVSPCSEKTKFWKPVTHYLTFIKEKIHDCKQLEF